jgi:hypothetical protein
MKSIIKLYIYQKPGEEQRALTADMSEWPELFGALLGVFDVEVEWPEVDANPTAILLEHYQQKMMQEGAEHDARMGVLMYRINSLQYLEHQSTQVDQ